MRLTSIAALSRAVLRIQLNRCLADSRPVTVYSGILSLSSFVAAMCAGFILAAAPRQPATRLAAVLAVAASWWVWCEARWNAAPDTAQALQWMHLSTPGWAFLGGLVPHLISRYLDLHPAPALEARRRLLGFFAGFGYAVAAVIVTLDWFGPSAYAQPSRVPWGWNYEPSPVQLAFLVAIAPGISAATATMLRSYQSPLAAAPRLHRVSIRVGLVLPAILTLVTDAVLPLAGVPFPRLGSATYAVLGLAALGTGLRYGLGFLAPRQFSEEILDALHEGVALITIGGVIRRANRGLARMTERPLQSLTGCDLRSILSWEPPTHACTVEGDRAMLLSLGGEHVPVLVSAVPLHDERGDIIAMVIVVRDLTEIEELRRRMLVQARLAAVGELAAGLAHEINNPLAFVRANLGQLERHWKAIGDIDAMTPEERGEISEEGRALIQESLVGVDRAAEIVRGVRRFTHGGRAAREPADLNTLIEDAIAMLRPRLQALAVGLELHLGEIPLVPCAPQELRQVFLNLLVNALDAVGTRGHVAVNTRCEAEAVVAEFCDDGCGIPSEVQERIFDPFFTTKQVGEGTGLGLGISWSIVTAHRGHIEVESMPGAGSTFRVRLPIAADAP
jgi:signal transduction histidine kinase